MIPSISQIRTETELVLRYHVCDCDRNSLRQLYYASLSVNYITDVLAKQRGYLDELISKTPFIMLYPELQCTFDVPALLNVYHTNCRLLDAEDELGSSAQRKMLEHFNQAQRDDSAHGLLQFKGFQREYIQQLNEKIEQILTDNRVDSEKLRSLRGKPQP